MLEAILETLSLFVLNTIEAWGSAGVFVLMALESANIPIPSEIIMPFSGFLVSRGVFNFWGIILVGALGNLAGSLVSYYAAVPLTKYLRYKREFIAAEKWYERFGEWSIFIGRLLPIIRTFISFPAGMFKVNVWRFSILTFAGSFLWVWLLTYIGFFLGENWDIIGPYFRKFDFVIVGVVIIGFLWWIWHHYKRRK